MKNLIISTLSAAIILFCFSCKGPQKSLSTSMSDNTETPMGHIDPATMGENIGATIETPDPITIPTLLTQLAAQDTVKTHLQAKVEGVCQVKGCWMNLVPTDGTTAESIFVKFKDYGFFMPLDLAGSEVIVDGIAYKEVTSIDELRHYAEDEGQSPEQIAQITQPVEELKFMADGVIILK